MRDERLGNGTATPSTTTFDSRSSQGLTRVGRQSESSSNRGGNLDRSASLTLAHKGMRLKSKGLGDLKTREVSERRQVGDAESMVNEPGGDGEEGKGRWWRNVGYDDV